MENPKVETDSDDSNFDPSQLELDEEKIDLSEDELNQELSEFADEANDLEMMKQYEKMFNEEERRSSLVIMEDNNSSYLFLQQSQPKKSLTESYTKDVRKHRAKSVGEASMMSEASLDKTQNVELSQPLGGSSKEKTCIEKESIKQKKSSASRIKNTVKSLFKSRKTAPPAPPPPPPPSTSHAKTTVPSDFEADLKVEDMDLPKFLDKHFEKIQPGVHKMDYKIAEVKAIVTAVTKVFASEETLIEVRAPMIVCGDVHGQFNDLINMFLLLGRPPKERFLFLGDYVDRGQMSLECIILLMCYKIQYPNSIYLLRGNHECARVCIKYGFSDEIKLVFGDGQVYTDIWALFQRAFNQMPIAGVIEGKILCMHGGLSPVLDSLDDIKKEKKPLRNPFKGVINDMMWADPVSNISFWRTSNRGSGFVFGEKVIEEACRRLNIELIIRAHQVCVDGFWCFANRKLVTVFSAPAYNNLSQNAGAALKIDSNLKCQFVAFVPNGPHVKQMITQRNQLWEKSAAPVNDGSNESEKPLPQAC